MSVNYYDSTRDLLEVIAGGGSEGSFHSTSPVTALTGATTVTIQDAKIHSTSLVFPFADDGGTEPLAPPSTITLSEGQCVLTFDALENDTDFTLVVLADSITEDAYLNDLTDVDISNPANGQVLGYNGTTQKWVNISLINDTTASSSTVYSSSKVVSLLPVLTSTTTALTGATTCTITDSAIHTTSKLIEPKCSVQGMSAPEMTITEGQCVMTFGSLAQDTDFALLIYN